MTVTSRTIVLNRVDESLPPTDRNILLWSEVEAGVLDCEWVRAIAVSELPVRPLINFSKPGVRQDLVWFSEGVAQPMKENDLWSIPVIRTDDEETQCINPQLALSC